MKLHELTGYKQDPYYQKAVELFKKYNITTNEKISLFADFMRKHGFNILGSGALGIAFEKPNYPWVFKMFFDDEGYLYYYNYARSHQNNPHVPKTKGGPLKLTDDSHNGKLYLVRIEKLTPLPNDAPFTDPAIHEIINLEYPDSLTPDIEEIIASKYPLIIPILKDILNSGFAIDLHTGNIMMRDNTPVITDPLIT